MTRFQSTHYFHLNKWKNVQDYTFISPYTFIWHSNDHWISFCNFCFKILFFRLLIDEVDEVVIAVHNLSDHPSLYSTNDLGSEDPLTKLRPRVRKCLEFITDEHYTNDFQALRRYCRQVIKPNSRTYPFSETLVISFLARLGRARAVCAPRAAR